MTDSKSVDNYRFMMAEPFVMDNRTYCLIDGIQFVIYTIARDILPFSQTVVRDTRNEIKTRKIVRLRMCSQSSHIHGLIWCPCLSSCQQAKKRISSSACCVPGNRRNVVRSTTRLRTSKSTSSESIRNMSMHTSNLLNVHAGGRPTALATVERSQGGHSLGRKKFKDFSRTFQGP